MPTARITRTAAPPTTPPTTGPIMFGEFFPSPEPPVAPGPESVDEGFDVAVDSGPAKSSIAAVMFHMLSPPTLRYAQSGIAVSGGISYGKLEAETVEQLYDHRLHEIAVSFWQVAQAAKSDQVTVQQLHGSSYPFHGPTYV